MTLWPRDAPFATAIAVEAAEDHDMSTWTFAIAFACGIWYFFILVVQAIGFIQLSVNRESLGRSYCLYAARFRYYSSKPKPAVSPTLKLEDVPHVTILRPVKGLEPQLYECLAATFHQDYPLKRLTIYFCVASFSDPAFPVLQRLLGRLSRTSMPRSLLRKRIRTWPGMKGKKIIWDQIPRSGT